MELNTHGYVIDLLTVEEEFGKWWRSEETIFSEHPYNGCWIRKDWPLKEALIMHMVRLQQENLIPDFLSD